MIKENERTTEELKKRVCAKYAYNSQNSEVI